MNFKLLILISIGLLFAAHTQAQETRPEENTGVGFFVKDGKIFDPTGSEFVPMGFNTSAFWRADLADCKRDNMSNAIPETGANAVRIVSQIDGSSGWNANPTDQRDLVDRAVKAGMVPMLEMHNATCDGNVNGILSYWKSPVMVQLCQDYERYLWINVANEHNFSSPEEWRDVYIKFIKEMRALGVRNLIVLDMAKNCGQNPEAIQKHAVEVLAADPLKNVLFSVHMYQFWHTSDQSYTGWTPPFSVEDDLPALKQLGVPVIVGEFGHNNSGDVNYTTDTLLSVCLANNIGWYVWCFYDNREAGGEGGVFNMIDDPCGGSGPDNRTESGNYFIPYIQEHADSAAIFNNPPSQYMSLSAASLKIGVEGGTAELSIHTNTDWSITVSDESWLSVSETSGNGDASLTISSGETTDIRTGTLTITASDIVRTVKVSQGNELKVSPSSLNFIGKSGTKGISIESNTEWVVTNDQSWISLSNASGNGNSVLMVSVENNATGSTRTGQVTITCSDLEEIVEITQTTESVEINRFEGEDFTAQEGGCIPRSDITGFSGEGFLDFAGNGSYAEWNNVNVQGGVYQLVFRYANGSDVDRSCELVVNDVALGTIDFSPLSSGDWTIWGLTDPVEVAMSGGMNSIRLTSNANGGPNFDYGEVSVEYPEDTTAVEFIKAVGQQQLMIYPVPANDHLSVEGVHPDALVKVYQMTGQLIMQEQLKEQSLCIDELKKGFYLLECEGRTGKFIVE